MIVGLGGSLNTAVLNNSLVPKKKSGCHAPKK